MALESPQPERTSGGRGRASPGCGTRRSTPWPPGRWTRGDADAVVVGSLTKLLACPGLRVGYVLVPEGEGRHDRELSAPATDVGGQRVGRLRPARAAGRRRAPRVGGAHRGAARPVGGGAAAPRARTPAVRRQLGARGGARFAGAPGASRDRGARLHELRTARAWCASPFPRPVDSSDSTRRCRPSTSPDSAGPSIWIVPSGPLRGQSCPPRRKVHHDRSEFLRRLSHGSARRQRGGVSRGRVPGPPDQAARVAGSPRGDRHPAVRHRRGLSSSGARAGHRGGVRRRSRGSRRRGDALAPRGDGADGGQLLRRGCRHQRARPPRRCRGRRRRRRAWPRPYPPTPTPWCAATSGPGTRNLAVEPAMTTDEARRRPRRRGRRGAAGRLATGHACSSRGTWGSGTRRRPRH